ncbi:hypothetical protein GCM10011375_29480 [Hymenobacter qilianensis]|uniref:Uncharacterized protein n=2 Tax=Hymenobacter qilianensis TaxID=1385715 RepID=A0ACB5PUA8_9BACT|nr:hypothetical protein [Hymenobacter qilianensis]QNP51727.1 hypothetical protein H9L05_17445 [Hymenobacter qilianensis]GGF72429.1 hypothetical protein GCM10011375_29480 [Hymenobacter qilianensis]
MPTHSNHYWLGCLLFVASGTLSGCNQTSRSQPPPASADASLYQLAVLRSEAESEEQKPTKKPKPGRKPKTKADYESAIASVKKYRQTHSAGGLHNGYLSKQVVKDLISSGKCEGIRVYLADSAGQERMVVIGVDKDGADLVTPTNLEDQTGLKSQGKYLFGITEDKCPENCIGATLYE